MRGPAVLVAGTDTGVGKTHVTCALARGLVASGLAVGVMKPCETGVADVGDGTLPEGSDAAALVAAAGCRASARDVRPYGFALPVAPQVAAQSAGVQIELSVLAAALGRLRAAHDVVLVEAAGGVLVPLAPGLTVVDLAVRLSLPVVLVARTGVGTLNHSALSARTLRAAGLRLLGVVLSSPAGPPSEADRANLSLFDELVQVPVLAELAHAPEPDAGVCAALAGTVAALLGLRRPTADR